MLSFEFLEFRHHFVDSQCSRAKTKFLDTLRQLCDLGWLQEDMLRFFAILMSNAQLSKNIGFYIVCLGTP